MLIMSTHSIPEPVQPRPDIERAAFRDALRDAGSALPGVFAWGVVTGMAMVKAGLSIAHAVGMTLVVFAGSAQLAALPLIVGGAPIWVIFCTALIVNLRFVIFAASLGPHFAHLPWYKRVWYGFFTADITIGFFPRRFPPESLYEPAGKLGYFCGIAYPNWLVWQVGSLLGIAFAGYIPSNWSIGFAGTLALLTITIPLTMNRAALVGVIVASAVAVAGMHWPFRLGLLGAVVAGMVAALSVDMVAERRKQSS